MAWAYSLAEFFDLGSPLLSNLVPVVALSYGVQGAVAAHGILAETEQFYDLSGGVTFLAAILLGFFLPLIREGHSISPNAVLEVANWRQVVLSSAVAIYAIRLASYLFIRVIQKGGDSRFDPVKGNPSFFFVIFMAQATWVVVCSLPATLVASVPASAWHDVPQVLTTDILGLALWIGGIAIEWTADWQKSSWSAEKRKKVHDEQFMTRGLFGVVRYPNYLGDITLWSGLATVAAGVLGTRSVRDSLGWTGTLGTLFIILVPYLSPVFDAWLLLRVSGVPLSQAKYDKLYGNREDYQKWRNKTPMVLPKFF